MVTYGQWWPPLQQGQEDDFGVKEEDARVGLCFQPLEPSSYSHFPYSYSLCPFCLFLLQCILNLYNQSKMVVMVVISLGQREANCMNQPWMAKYLATGVILLLLRNLSFCCSVAQSYPTLRDPMDCSTPDFPVLHHLPELAQIHIH